MDSFNSPLINAPVVTPEILQAKSSALQARPVSRVLLKESTLTKAETGTTLAGPNDEEITAPFGEAVTCRG